MVVLPEDICGKVEGFGDGRTGGTAEPEPDGFAANAPGPPVEPRFCETGSVRPAGFTCLSVCERQTDGQGFRTAGVHFVGPLGRSSTTTFAILRVDRLAVRETELTIANLISLSLRPQSATARPRRQAEPK